MAPRSAKIVLFFLLGGLGVWYLLRRPVIEKPVVLSRPVHVVSSADIATPVRGHLEEALREEAAGRVAEAVSAYEKVLAEQPDLAAAYVALGKLYFKMRLPGKARETYLAAEARGLMTSEMYLQLGYIEEASGKLSEAVSYYRKAEDLGSRDPALYFNMGNVLVQNGEMEKALGYYQKVLALDPQHLDTQVNLSVVSFRLGRYPDAQFYLEKAVRLGYNAPREYQEILKEKNGQGK